ncbi:uncharacterized protein LOC135366803 isoform X2 [Ornithodoros turicata]|uniref:uncharacterized protein LOC135366803 isoform X2 n=1 Tax=Ornithodoros turicata TaxID=34597 RepID=UPI003139205B
MDLFSCFDCCRKEVDDERSESQHIPALFYEHAVIHKPVIWKWVYCLHVAMHKAWLSRKAIIGVDLCCGPMVHHAAVLSGFLESVYLADPIEENRRALCSWLDGDPGCLDHDPFLAMVAKVEELPETIGVNFITTRLRKAVRGVLQSSFHHPYVLPKCHGASAFDVVLLMTRTLETFCSDADSYAAVIRRVNFLLPIGGLLILVGVLGRTASNVTMRPATKETLETALLNSGFGNLQWYLKNLDPRPCSHGVYSYLLLSNKLWGMQMS